MTTHIVPSIPTTLRAFKVSKKGVHQRVFDRAATHPEGPSAHIFRRILGANIPSKIEDSPILGWVVGRKNAPQV